MIVQADGPAWRDFFEVAIQGSEWLREHIFLQREKAESPQRFCGRKGWFYEKKRKRLTAFLLAALMMFSCMSVSAFAAEVPENSEEQTEQEVLQLVSMTSDTIVLKVEDGYEYGIQIEENDETVWSWAREEQYSDGEDERL